jgi:hypothetical protein
MKYIIFAPHIDDETIGCHSLLVKGAVTRVYYFFEFDKERVNEGLAASYKFGFTPFIVSNLDTFKNASKKYNPIFDPDITILVPRIDDHHPAHKMVNRMAKGVFSNLLFYSIDMNSGATQYRESDRKKAHLYHLYPSQKQYFDDCPQCYQFEHISETDGVDFGGLNG